MDFEASTNGNVARTFHRAALKPVSEEREKKREREPTTRRKMSLKNRQKSSFGLAEWIFGIPAEFFSLKAWSGNFR